MPDAMSDAPTQIMEQRPRLHQSEIHIEPRIDKLTPDPSSQPRHIHTVTDNPPTAPSIPKNPQGLTPPREAQASSSPSISSIFASRKSM